MSSDLHGHHAHALLRMALSHMRLLETEVVQKQQVLITPEPSRQLHLPAPRPSLCSIDWPEASSAGQTGRGGIVASSRLASAWVLSLRKNPST